MGLDMFLFGRKTFWSFNNEDAEQSRQLKTVTNAFPELVENKLEVDSVRIEAMYWRKANAIHKWFVDNVQDGVDQCQTSYVTRDQLEQLLAEVNYVIMNPESAPTRLPTTHGFFFGSDDYGKWYFHQLENTKARLTMLLSPAFADWTFEYHASW